MKLFKCLGLVALFIIATGCSETEQAAPEMVEAAAYTRPNILFIVADDLGFTDLGSFGSEISTPALDDLAYRGLRITNMHAGPACSQTRAMLMASSGYARATEYRPPLEGGQRDNLLKLDYAIIPELLQDAGYATYMTGKWDLGWDDGYTPATRGFDRSFVQLNGSSSYFREYFLMSGVLGFVDDGVPLELDDLDEDFYVTDHYTNKMLDYLSEAEAGKPWFAYMPYTAPHWPLQLPDDEWLNRYAGRYEMGYDELREQRFERAMELGVIPANSSLENFVGQAEPWANLSSEEQRKYSRAQEIYAGMVEHLDMSIARVISFLEESGQLDNTVIIFTSDHGASSGEHGVATGRVPQGGGPTIPDHIDNSFENFGRINSFIDHGRGFGESASAPFRYVKGSITEGGVRAAGFIHYPAEIEAGGVSSAYMTMMDFLPTFLEIADTEHPGSGTFRGREIVDILGASAWPHLTGESEAVHGENYSVGWSSGGGGSLIRGDYKLINTMPPGQRGTTDWRLYNLIADPGEHQDIATQHLEMVAEMFAEWEINWK